MLEISELMERHAGVGRADWIGLRPARGAAMHAVARAAISPGGLEGDRARAGKRAVTLIQGEHLPVIGALAHRGAVSPEELRRNIVISGINLGALRGRRLWLGTALLEITVVCAPCSRMETALGQGGYNAMRGHGGWCAQVLEPGEVALGDAVRPQG